MASVLRFFMISEEIGAEKGEENSRGTLDIEWWKNDGRKGRTIKEFLGSNLASDMALCRTLSAINSQRCRRGVCIVCTIFSTTSV